MPEMDGIETLHEIRKLSDFPNEDTPVIVLTANALSGAKEGYLKEGFADFLTKPIDGDLLEQTVEKYLPSELVHRTENAGEVPLEESVRIDHEHFLTYDISIENGLAYAKGDLEMYLELARLFLGDRGKQEVMRQLLTEGNIKDYAILVHGLKGNARTLGADRLADMAFTHEKESKAGNTAYADSHFEELLGVWENTLAGFAELLHSCGKGENDKYGAAASDGEEVLLLSENDLEAVAALLDDFETQKAIEQLKIWIQKPLEPSMYERVKNVLIALEDEFDEDKATELLREKGGNDNDI